jgi:hypothetical protein
MLKFKQGFMTGTLATIGGMVLAVSAQSIAFMNVRSYSLPRSESSYAVQEHLLQQIGLLFIAFGLLLILITFREYLRTCSSDG